MQRENKHDDLLVKYFLNWCNAEEQSFVEDWLSSSKNNQLYFDKLVKSEKLVAIMHGIRKIDVDSKWEDFQHLQETKRQSPFQFNQQEDFSQETALTDKGHSMRWRSVFMNAFKVAALLILVVVIGIKLFQHNSVNTVEIARNNAPRASNSITAIFVVEENETARVKVVTFPDQTMVRLFPGSKLTYSEPVERNYRRVSLSGKANFQVSKNKAKPFTVYSGDITTTALGTEFTITSFPNGKNIIVRLYNGQVVIRSASGAKRQLGKNYYLLPRQELIYDKVNFSATIREFGIKKPVKESGSPVNDTSSNDNPAVPQLGNESWFMFNNQPLDLIFDQLNKMFDADIEYAKKDFSETFLIGTFSKSDSLEVILNQIVKLNKLKMIKKGNKYIIRK